MKSEDANIIIKMKRNIHHLILRKRIHKRSFTLISQNCVGGVIYHMLDMPFKTPTINLYINDGLIYSSENVSFFKASSLKNTKVEDCILRTNARFICGPM